MIKTLIVAARDRERLAEIANVAARYGLGVLLDRLGLPLARGGEEAAPADLPRRTREAIEALGPTFMKLGQILATRRDLLPEPWIAELERLHSDAPALPFEALRPQVEAALGEPPESAFAEIETEPLAAASIAQVHRATLKDGRTVVLKIRRPDIERRMEADLRLIRHLAGIAERGSAEVRRLRPQALVEQLARDVLDEVDFTIEGRNADRLRADLADNPRILIPEIHWEWTSRSLLVMDHVDGVAPRSAEALEAQGIDPQAIAELGAALVLDMVLVHGRFHGDPHPGNLLCLPGNRLALLDLGLVGHVGARRRDEFLTFLLSLRGGDAPALADTLAAWSSGGGIPRERMLAIAERLVARHGAGPLRLDALVADFFPLLREEGLLLPPDLLLIFKAMITMDGVLGRIAPGFDLAASVQRARARLVLGRLARSRGTERAEALLLELARLSDDAPRLLRALVRRIESKPAAEPERGAEAAGAKWIAGSILLGAALIATAILA